VPFFGGKLSAGAGQLRTGLALWAGGASRLADGLDEVASGFESGLGGASATKLAAPVEVRVERTAPCRATARRSRHIFRAFALGGRFDDELRLLSAPAAGFHAVGAASIKWFAKASTLLVLGRCRRLLWSA